MTAKTLLCVALGLLLALQGARSHSEEVKECGEENGVKADDMRKFFSTKEATQDVKCFLKCVLMHMDVLKEDGSFDTDNIKDHDDEIAPVGAFKECAGDVEKNDDLCEMAFQHSLCMMEKVPSQEKLQKSILEHLE